jgi:hypothetical protein
MNDTNTDIFGEVADTEVPTTQADPTKQLFNIPESTGVEWFLPKRKFAAPKETKDCTTSLVVRFLSWKIRNETQTVYQGSGISTPGTLRNQMVVRYHPIPEGYDAGLSGRVPCHLQFGETCAWCGERAKADKRFTRDKQPANYFRDVIAKFKAKDKTVMLGNVYQPNETTGQWETDGVIYAFEFSDFVRNGRTFSQIINDRANDADKRIRIDKKSYAGYVSPVAIKITYSWPTKAGKPEKGQFSTWAPTDATPFPIEAGGPDVSKFTKEWAMGVAQHDPAAWINRTAFAKVDPVDVGRWIYDLFTGKVSLAPKVDLDTADFGQLLAVIEANKDKFADLDVAEFSYDMVEQLRPIVKGVLNG